MTGRHPEFSRYSLPHGITTVVQSKPPKGLWIAEVHVQAVAKHLRLQQSEGGGSIERKEVLSSDNMCD
jgi:hypothetical protein